MVCPVLSLYARGTVPESERKDIQDRAGGPSLLGAPPSEGNSARQTANMSICLEINVLAPDSHIDHRSFTPQAPKKPWIVWS
jgi:hypothetical protein